MRKSKTATNELKKLRQSLGLTQSEMGLVLGLSKPTIQSMELGILKITSQTMARIESLETDSGCLIEKRVEAFRSALLEQSKATRALLKAVLEKKAAVAAVDELKKSCSQT